MILYNIAVTASHQITQEWREYERTSTTVLNSYVKPIVTSYINKLEQRITRENEFEKYIMQSNGGVNTFEEVKETPINIVESGPVAGIFGAAILGELIGEDQIISFDIGGTTAKCSLIDQGEVKVTTDYKIEASERNPGYPIKVPVVDIVEIGNGGGSIAWIDNDALKVGPQSAGAKPGPVAYGIGGENPTTTDANIVTGRLSIKNFDQKGNIAEVERAIKEKIADYFGVSTSEAALGIIRIANANMLNALKLISVRKGYDPSEFTLIATGGGGPMHATALASELGVKKVVIPVAASVFSAWGMLMTDLRKDYIKTNIVQLNEHTIDQLNEEWIGLKNKAIVDFKNQGLNNEDVLLSCYFDMRYKGQEHTVKVPVSSFNLNEQGVEEVIQKFHELHEQQYSFKLQNTSTEIVNFHLISLGKVEKPQINKISPKEGTIKRAFIESRDVLYEDYGFLKTDVYGREYLSVGDEIEGPAIIEEQATSTVVYPNQLLTVDNYGNLIITI